MRKYRSFRDDEQIGEHLDAIPKNERSTIIRMALRWYFGITPKRGGVTRDRKNPARSTQGDEGLRNSG